MPLKLVLFLMLCVVTYGDDILCTEASCEKYGCSNIIPDECTIQNATHSGIYLPFPGLCNCCDYCLKNLDFGDDCTIGEPGTPPSDSVCGDLLYCVTHDPTNSDFTNGTCEIVATDCTDKQKEYDEKLESGTLGHLEVREQCSRRGQYSHYKCVPGEICYCVSDKGERIFGEMPFTTLAEHLLKCECSKNYRKMSEFMGRDLHVGEFMRCQPNGDYDTMQCIGEECICVDAVDGVETYPSSSPVNVTEISNDTMPCFNNLTHMEGGYYRQCEEEYMELLELIDEFEVDGVEVIGAVFPNCQLDGRYGPVQKFINDSITYFYCADPDGNKLEEFELQEGTKGVETMNCACARSRNITTVDKPTCCENGNYNPLQCRRGFCRCVDENGNQIEKEVHINNQESLSCSDGCTKVMV